MTKLAIIDLDGVIVDNSERMESAEKRRDYYRQHLGDCMPGALGNPHNHAYVQKGFNDLLENLYWQAAFTPDSVRLDTLIEGVYEAVDKLDEQRYQIIFLTSRPESMRAATEEWLHNRLLLMWAVTDFPGFLVMKSLAFQFTKTAIWKAGMIEHLVALYGADDVLVIEDDQKNLDEIGKYIPQARLYASLATAIAPPT